MKRGLLAGFFILATACSRNIEVDKALKITDVHTGWYDAGIQPDGKNKLVPSVAFKLQNVWSHPVTSVQLNAVFRQIGDTQAWGEHFVKGIGSNGLQPGATSGDVVLRSNLGYTGTESRLQMLQNRQFVDAKVEIFGKHGSRTWVKMGEYRIDRQLLTQ
jgi:hypothetical protein